tara:strand:+ start:9217 stop:9813 length:597 start_codon:yes stop_codon:yes gene_type:complete
MECTIDNKEIKITHANLIKKIIYDFIQNEYKNYLIENNTLLINEEDIYNAIYNLYDKNIKILKSIIRNKLKSDINSLSLENLILEIFSEKDKNIKNLKEEFVIMQRHNLKSLTLPIINNSLNISISIEYSFVKIDKVNTKNISEHTEIYDILNNYKYIYSINNIILEKIENDNKIEFIKNLLENKKEIDVECYILKNN